MMADLGKQMIKDSIIDLAYWSNFNSYNEFHSIYWYPLIGTTDYHSKKNYHSDLIWDILWLLD